MKTIDARVIPFAQGFAAGVLTLSALAITFGVWEQAQNRRSRERRTLDYRLATDLLRAYRPLADGHQWTEADWEWAFERSGVGRRRSPHAVRLPE